jgi:serine/threonine protein kinase
MAPEVVLGGTPSEQSDIYSLGVLLFYLLTGTYPIYATRLDELRRLHERQGERDEKSVATVLRELRPGLPRALARAVATALAPVHRRYRTPAELQEALERSSRPPWHRLAVAGVATAAVAAALWLASIRPPVAPPAAPRPGPPTSAPTPTPTTEAAPSTTGVSLPAGARAIPARPAPRDTPSWPGVTLMIVTRTSPPRHEDTPAPTAEPSPTEAPATEPATLLLKIKPWAEVTVDGTPQGPIEHLSLPAGSHRLVLSHPDYQPLKRAVILMPGETKALTVDLRDEAVKQKR